MAPVPAQAMHFRNPRRSIPSLLWSCSMTPLGFGSKGFFFAIRIFSGSEAVVLHNSWTQATQPLQDQVGFWLASPVRTCYTCINQSRSGFIPSALLFYVLLCGNKMPAAAVNTYGRRKRGK